MAQTFDGVAAEGGVGGDDAVHGVAFEGGGYHVNLGVVQVGGDFDEDGHAFAVLGGQGFAALGNSA